MRILLLMLVLSLSLISCKDRTGACSYERVKTGKLICRNAIANDHCESLNSDFIHNTEFHEDTLCSEIPEVKTRMFESTGACSYEKVERDMMFCYDGVTISRCEELESNFINGTKFHKDKKCSEIVTVKIRINN